MKTFLLTSRDEHGDVVLFVEHDLEWVKQHFEENFKKDRSYHYYIEVWENGKLIQQLDYDENGWILA